MTPEPHIEIGSDRNGRRFNRLAWFWTVGWMPEAPDRFGVAVSGFSRTRLGARFAAWKEARP